MNMSFYKKINLIEQLLANFFTRVILYLTDGFLIAGAGLIVPIFAIFVERIGGSLIEVGIASALFSFTAGIGILIISRFEDAHNRNFRQFVVLGYLLALTGYLNYLFLSTVTHLYFAQVLLGIASAVRVPSYDALLSRNTPNHLAVACGNWNAVVYIVSASAALIGASIASAYGFKLLILVMVFLSSVAFLLSLALLKVKTLKSTIKKSAKFEESL